MPPIHTDGLTKYYGDVRGVEDLTFAVEEGEVFGFLGPNGAGEDDDHSNADGVHVAD